MELFSIKIRCTFQLVSTISYRKLKALGAKRRVYKNTKEVFFLIEADYNLTL